MSNIPLVGDTPSVPGNLYTEAESVRDQNTTSQALFRGGLKKSKLRRPPVVVPTPNA